MLDLRRALAPSQPHLRDVVPWRNRLSYLAWHAGLLGQRAKTFPLVTGERIVLRRQPAGDTWVATEVFLLEDYKPPESVKDVRHIVDLGANVGYATVYLARQFPDARLEAFEPHPAHLIQLAANIAANSLGHRLTIHPYAVGCSEETLFLTDDRAHSRVVRTPTDSALPVKVIDWLDFALKQEKIDLLKLDIEGGEYDFLLDPRFAALQIPSIVLEWHATRERPQADSEIISKLTGLGYVIQHIATKQNPEMRLGLFWALRPTS